MTDYISRKAIITWIEKSLAMYHDKYSTDMLHMFGLFRSAIEDKSLFPAADVVEQKVGKWIWDDEGYHCSECFFHTYGNTLECMDGTYAYCPSCGARMVDK